MPRRPQERDNCSQSRVAAVIALACFTLFTAAPIAASVNAAELMGTICAGDWETAARVVARDTLCLQNPVKVLILAHRSLALGDLNEASALFRVDVVSSGTEPWSEWTSSLAKRCPKSALAHYLRGDALLRAGDLDKGIAELSTSIDLDPEFFLAWNARGVGYGLLSRRSGNKDYLNNAHVDLRQASSLNPGFADAPANAGVIYIMDDRAGASQKAFSRALSVDSTFALAINGLACSEAHLGLMDLAASGLAKAWSARQLPIVIDNAEALREAGHSVPFLEEIDPSDKKQAGRRDVRATSLVDKIKFEGADITAKFPFIDLTVKFGWDPKGGVYFPSGQDTLGLPGAEFMFGYSIPDPPE